MSRSALIGRSPTLPEHVIEIEQEPALDRLASQDDNRVLLTLSRALR